MDLRLRLVSVPVSDVDLAKAFYVEKLGFEEKVDTSFGEGMRWVELGPPAPDVVTISLVTWFEETMPPGSLHGVVLHTDDIRESYAELVERGVDFSGPIEDATWGSHASFRDPDGNGWVLVQPPTGAA